MKLIETSAVFLSSTHDATELEAFVLSLLEQTRTLESAKNVFSSESNTEAILAQRFLEKQLPACHVSHLLQCKAWHMVYSLLKEGSFTLEMILNSMHFDTESKKLKTILLSMRSLKQRESKKGIKKVFECNFKKVLKTCSLKKKWSFSTRNDFYLSRSMILDNCRQ